MKSAKIIIASYNAENRIQKILKSIAIQKIEKGWSLKIIVHSDKSSDNTISVAKKIKSKDISVIDSVLRLGFAGVVKKYIEANRSDLLILLNDDIIIHDKTFIQNIISTYSETKNMGLACVDIKPVHSKTFIQKATNSSFKAYRKMSYSYNNGKNIFSCDGKVLILTKDFTKKIKFPKDTAQMGNVDAYLYLSCLKLKFNYMFIKNTSVYFTFPSTVKDYLNWTARNNSNFYLLQREFKSLVLKEYRKPKSLIMYQAFQFLKNPTGSIFVYLMRILVNNRAKKNASDFNSLWDTIKTSKLLDA